MDRSITLDRPGILDTRSPIKRLSQLLSKVSKIPRTLRQSPHYPRVHATTRTLAVAGLLGIWAYSATQKSTELNWELTHPPGAHQWTELFIQQGYRPDPQGPRAESQDSQNAELWIRPNEVSWGDALFVR